MKKWHIKEKINEFREEKKKEFLKIDKGFQKHISKIKKTLSKSLKSVNKKLDKVQSGIKKIRIKKNET